MTPFDFAMIGIIILAALQGAWRGMAWQAAPIVSLILGYIVAVPLSEQLAPHFGEQAPTNRYIALLVCYVAVAMAVYLVARLLRQSIEAIKLAEFDRHLGALLGVVKGALAVVVITFFAVGLSEQTRDYVLKTKSGRTAGYVMHQVQPILPDSMENLLAPYIAQMPNEPPKLGFPGKNANPIPTPAPKQVAQQKNESAPAAGQKSPTDPNTPPPVFLEDVLRLVERIEAERKRR